MMSKGISTEFGVIKQICVYPVKAFGGVQLTETWVGWHGLDADRRYAFYKKDSLRGFPWLTIRDVPTLATYLTSFENPDDVRRSRVRVKTPTGTECYVESSQLLAEVNASARFPVGLIHSWSGFYDSMDISLLTTQSVAWACQQAPEEAQLQRFRANVVIDAFSDLPFSEEKLLKSLLVFGEGPDSARIRVNRKTMRCMVINVDHKVGLQTPSVLKRVVGEHKNMLGVYATTERPGKIRVGDIVRVER